MAEKVNAKRSLDDDESVRKYQRTGPTPKHLQRLHHKLDGTEVPLLSAEEIDALVEIDVQWLGAGSYGEAFLNADKDVVLKFSRDYNTFVSSINEAKSMMTLKDIKGVQQLVGVCPERFVLVTKYAGYTIRKWIGKKSPLLPLQLVEVAISIAEIFAKIHLSGVVHNDIKSDNLCLLFTTKGLKATLIDFGMAKNNGIKIELEGEWDPEQCNPPEFFKELGGECSPLSDVYSIGGLMDSIYKRAGLDNSELSEWIRKSQSQEASERGNLEGLLNLLRAERNILEESTYLPVS